MQSMSVIILAAGQGSRMRSNLPKVLHPIAGKPMLHHVIETAQTLSAREIHVVYGHGGEKVLAASEAYPLQWHLQKQQLGTGHAVDQAVPAIDDEQLVLVLYGDVPLISTETLGKLIQKVTTNTLALLTVILDDPQGYGRIVRNDKQQVEAIVEQKDANPEQLQISEVNTGILAAKAKHLKRWLSNLDNSNAQSEYYLTDIVAMAVADDFVIETEIASDSFEVEGVNNRHQQARLERRFQQLQAEALMQAGVTLMDPARIDIRGSLKTGEDVCIDVGVVFEGEVELGDGVSIGPGCVIKDAIIGKRVTIEAHCVLQQCEIGEAASIGPFARLRPGTKLAEKVHVGNFVEIKNSTLGVASKAGHLAYLGDSEIGKNVNIGAGTITCNYDGANKHKTVIEDNAFIGSDSQLVAPVVIGKNVTIGAGTTVTEDVAADHLAVSRVKQRQIKGWNRPVKKK